MRSRVSCVDGAVVLDDPPQPTGPRPNEDAPAKTMNRLRDKDPIAFLQVIAGVCWRVRMLGIDPPLHTNLLGV